MPGSVLALDSAACQEAALQPGPIDPPDPRCEEMIDHYLASERMARPSLSAYARAARTETASVSFSQV